MFGGKKEQKKACFLRKTILEGWGDVTCHKLKILLPTIKQYYFLIREHPKDF